MKPPTRPLAASSSRGGSFPAPTIENRERNRRFAAMAAAIFGADADEIALTHSATEGLGTALMGMTWSPGDEIVTTFEEHPGLLLPLALLARRFGVVTRYADIGDGASGVVEALASRITSRTRVIAVSHVLWSTGAVLPLREISELARQHELMVVVDGAQSAGQVPVDLHAMGIDAYAMAGQKWLCGPGGDRVCSTSAGIALPISRRRSPATGSSNRAAISSPPRARCGTRSASSTARRWRPRRPRCAGCATRSVSTGRTTALPRLAPISGAG